MPPKIHPDDACRNCRGTGREVEVQTREGKSFKIYGPCYLCHGTGSKLVVFGGVSK